MIATVSSVTTANRMKRIMAGYGVTIEVMQTPKAISSGGCGYCIRFAPEHLGALLQTIADYGLEIRKLFHVETAGGETHYVRV